MLAENGQPLSGARITQSHHLVDNLDELKELAGDWRALESMSDEPCFFNSFAWCGQIAQMMAQLHPTVYKPLIAVAMSNNHVSAIWPLSLQRSFGLWTLANLDEPFGQMAGILASDQHSADGLVAATFKAVRERRLAASARFERVEIGSRLHRALSKAGAVQCGHTQAPVVEVAKFQSFETLLRSRKKKTRRNLRTATNRLARAGRIKSILVKDEEALRPLIVKTLANRRNWLTATGRTSPAFRLSGHDNILTRSASGEGGVQRIGFELFLDDRSIAQQWGYIHQKRYYAYMSSMDLDFRELSPGSLHLAHVIEALMAEGVEALELLTPASPYKMRWTDSIRELDDMTIDFGFMGWAKNRLWDSGARPMLKAGFYRIPLSLRRWLESRSVNSSPENIK